MEKWVNFEKDIWFELGKCMWSKHRGVFQDHLKYICNDIVKPFCVGIICCYEHVQEIHDPEKHLPQTSMKGKSFETDSWKVWYK